MLHFTKFFYKITGFLLNILYKLLKLLILQKQYISINMVQYASFGHITGRRAWRYSNLKVPRFQNGRWTLSRTFNLSIVVTMAKNTVFWRERFEIHLRINELLKKKLVLNKFLLFKCVIGPKACEFFLASEAPCDPRRSRRLSHAQKTSVESKLVYFFYISNYTKWLTYTQFIMRVRKVRWQRVLMPNSENEIVHFEAVEDEGLHLGILMSVSFLTALSTAITIL